MSKGTLRFRCAYPANEPQCGIYNKGAVIMRVIAGVLIVIGILGLILSSVIQTIGIPGIIGSVTAIVAGIGFLLLVRCWSR